MKENFHHLIWSKKNHTKSSIKRNQIIIFYECFISLCSYFHINKRAFNVCITYKKCMNQFFIYISGAMSFVYLTYCTSFFFMKRKYYKWTIQFSFLFVLYIFSIFLRYFFFILYIFFCYTYTNYNILSL